MTSTYKFICHIGLILALDLHKVTAQFPKVTAKTCQVSVQKEFQAMDHDKHQNQILALGLALMVATVLVLVSMQDGASGDGRALHVRDEPVVIVNTLPVLRTVSQPVSSLTVNNRTPIQDRR